MARSLKKGPFVHYKLDKKFRKILPEVIKEWLRLGLELQ